MWGILISAFNFVLGWIFRGVIMKFVVMSILYYVVTEIVNYVMTKLDLGPVTNLQSTVNDIPASILFFLGVFRIDIGLPMILGAMLTGFLIRRIPIIG